MLVLPKIIFWKVVFVSLSLLLFFVSLNLERGIVTIILAHITFSTAFAAVVISSRLVNVDKSLEEAAMDLGCNAASAFIKVTLPALLPAVAAAWLLSFTLSLDDLVIAAFTSGPSATTLPMKIYSQVRLGVTPEINALSSVLLGLVTVSVIIAAISSKHIEIRRLAYDRKAQGLTDKTHA